MTRAWIAAVALALAPAPVASAQSYPAPDAGYVHDFAGMLSDLVEDDLEGDLGTFEARTTTEVAVVTIESLDGADLEEYSLELASRWGVGQEESDNGVMLLIVERDRALRIEVGTGLESALTDEDARRIVDDVIAPRFAEGDFDFGVAAGVDAIMDAAQGVRAEPSRVDDSATVVFTVIVVGGLVTFAIWGALGRRRGYWYSGPHHTSYTSPSSAADSFAGGSSGGGFGGGGFGGGGASGRW